MKPPLENIHITLQGKEHLLKLKKTTGIEQWNVLCRWAFCISLAEKTRLELKKLPADSNIELSWKTFTGPYSDVIRCSLIISCNAMNIQNSSYADALRCHIHRGLILLPKRPIENFRFIDALEK